MTDLLHSMSTLSLAPPPHQHRSLRTHTSTCTCYACSTGSQSKLVSWAVSESPRSPSPSNDICDKPWLLPTSVPNSPPPIYRRVARPINLPARPTFDDDDDIMADRARANEIPTTPMLSHHTWLQQQQSCNGHPLKPSPTFQSLTSISQHSSPPSSSDLKLDSTPHTLHIHPSPPQFHSSPSSFHTSTTSSPPQFHHSSSSFNECKLDCESPNYQSSSFQPWRETTRTPTSITV